MTILTLAQLESMRMKRIRPADEVIVTDHGFVAQTMSALGFPVIRIPEGTPDWTPLKGLDVWFIGAEIQSIAKPIARQAKSVYACGFYGWKHICQETGLWN